MYLPQHSESCVSRHKAQITLFPYIGPTLICSTLKRGIGMGTIAKVKSISERAKKKSEIFFSDD